MTKAFLSQNFDTVFQYHFLVTKHFYKVIQDTSDKWPYHQETLIASANATPRAGQSAFAFFPALDDFAKITEADVVAIIRNIKPKI